MCSQLLLRWFAQQYDIEKSIDFRNVYIYLLEINVVYLNWVFFEKEVLGVVSVGDNVATGVWAKSRYKRSLTISPDWRRNWTASSWVIDDISTSFT